MILVRFMGGFANQLFEYALFLKIKEIFPGTNVRADISAYDTDKNHGGFKLDKLVDLSYARRDKRGRWKKIGELNFDEKFKKIKISRNYLFEGYWQDRKYFPTDISPILDLFKKVEQDICSNEKQQLNRQYKDRIEQTNSVSVHVRRGDYVNHPMHGFIATKAYYNNAIKMATNDIENASFFVFSDDIKWAEDNINFGQADVVYIEGNDVNVEYDIYLMSRCKNHIIANSSFSWWGQFLNQNTAKRVYSPEKWYNNLSKEHGLLDESSIKVSGIQRLSAGESNRYKPYFSILIHNEGHAKYIDRAISSAYNQTIECEVIVIDSLNTELHTKGKYIVEIGGNDYLDENACEIMLNNPQLLNKFNECEFYHGYVETSNSNILARVLRKIKAFI